MLRAGAGYAARDYLAALRDVSFELVDVLVVYMLHLIDAEVTYLRPAFAAFAVECAFHL